MTKKLMLGIFLASLLLLTNLAFAGEKSSPVPAIAKVDAVSSDCNCLKKDKAPTSPRLRPDVLPANPSLIPHTPPCTWYLVCVRYCTTWPGCGGYSYGDCMQYEYRCGATFHGAFY